MQQACFYHPTGKRYIGRPRRKRTQQFLWSRSRSSLNAWLEERRSMACTSVVEAYVVKCIQEERGEYLIMLLTITDFDWMQDCTVNLNVTRKTRAFCPLEMRVTLSWWNVFVTRGGNTSYGTEVKSAMVANSDLSRRKKQRWGHYLNLKRYLLKLLWNTMKAMLSKCNWILASIDQREFYYVISETEEV